MIASHNTITLRLKDFKLKGGIMRFMRKRITAISRCLVGKTLSQAFKIAAQNNSTLRIVEKDDIPLQVDNSFVTDRVNVAISGDKIIRIVSLG